MTLIIDIIFFSYSCLIDEGESFLLTGGFLVSTGGYGVSTVSRYNINGWVEDLDDLITGRNGHGCTQYKNHLGDRVGFM